MKAKPKNAFEVARDAQMQADRGISSREDLLAALAAQFECADRIDALGRHITELAALESQLSASSSAVARSSDRASARASTESPPRRRLGYDPPHRPGHTRSGAAGTTRHPRPGSTHPTPTGSTHPTGRV